MHGMKRFDYCDVFAAWQLPGRKCRCVDTSSAILRESALWDGEMRHGSTAQFLCTAAETRGERLHLRKLQ